MFCTQLSSFPPSCLPLTYETGKCECPAAPPWERTSLLNTGFKWLMVAEQAWSCSPECRASSSKGSQEGCIKRSCSVLLCLLSAGQEAVLPAHQLSGIGGWWTADPSPAVWQCSFPPRVFAVPVGVRAGSWALAVEFGSTPSRPCRASCIAQ